MSNIIGTAYEDEFLDSVLGTGRYPSMPLALYAALWTVTPARDGTGGTEVADANDYARVAFSNNSNWAAAASNLKANAQVLTFPQATGSWGTVAGITFHTSGTWGAGNLFLVADLVTPKAIGSGDAPFFPIGNCKWMAAA